VVAAMLTSRQFGTTLEVSSTSRGRFGAGEIYTRRAVQIRQAALGPAHVAVAKDIASLAVRVQEQQRFDDAERVVPARARHL
jgi:hypothetical protein